MAAGITQTLWGSQSGERFLYSPRSRPWQQQGRTHSHKRALTWQTVCRCAEADWRCLMKHLLILLEGGTGRLPPGSFLFIFLRQRQWQTAMWMPNLHLVAAPPGCRKFPNFWEGRRLWLILINVLAAGSVRPHCRLNILLKRRGRYRVNEYACEKAAVCALCMSPKGSVSCGGCGRQKGTIIWARMAVLKNGRGNSGKKLLTNVKMAMLKHAPGNGTGHY